MNETLGIILIAVSVGFYMESNKPQYYLVHFRNGDIVPVEIRMQGSYFCPVYCAVDHAHLGHNNNYKCDLGINCYHFMSPPDKTNDTELGFTLDLPNKQIVK